MLDSEAVTGVIKGAQDLAAIIGPETIKLYVAKFLKKELAFLEDKKDKEEIELIKEETKKSDFLFYKRYLSDPVILRLIAMGFGLRRLKGHNVEHVNKFRKKIIKKYGLQGLHVAELAQTQIPASSRDVLFQGPNDDETLKRKMTNFFERIEQYTIFIRLDLSIEEQIEEVLTKIRTFSPETFLFISRGEASRHIQKISQSVLKVRSDYKIEEKHSDSDKSYVIIVRQPVLESSLSDHLRT